MNNYTGFQDAVGQPLDIDDRVAHLSSARNINGKGVFRATIVGFTEKLVCILIDEEDTPKNVNHFKLVLLKDQSRVVPVELSL